MTLVAVQVPSAQVTGNVEFTTSFPFVVGNTTVPAGSYTLRADDDNPEIMELRGPQTTVLFEVQPTEALDVAPQTEISFQRYGDTYVLKTVSLEGSAEGAESVTAEAERHQAKNGTPTGEEHIAATR
jgi:hypothetical protein